MLVAIPGSSVTTFGVPLILAATPSVLRTAHGSAIQSGIDTILEKDIGCYMRVFVSVFLVLVTSSVLAAAPCSGVDRHFNSGLRASLSSAIAKQLDVGTVDVLQFFRVKSWSIVYIDTHQADPVFLFFEHNPVTSRYVTQWSGAATSEEENSIRDWTSKNAPGIPTRLAQCFAWYVTKGRDL